MVWCFPAQDPSDPFRVGYWRTVSFCGKGKFGGQLKFCAPLIVLIRLVISARKQLDLGSKSDEADITPETVSIKAYHTLRVLFNRWPLSNMKKVRVGIVVFGLMG